VLTNAAQVRALSQAQAAQHFSVRLRGIVIGEAEPDGQGFVMRDASDSIYLLGQAPLVSEIERGDLLEVAGLSDPGGFAPCVLVKELRKVGTGTVPEPLPVTFEQLMAGRLDAQWIEVSGIVRRCEPLPWSERKHKLEIATGGERLTVQLNGRQKPEALVDAEVLLRGICFYQYNKNRQALSPLLLVPRGVAVAIEKAAPAAPYEDPPRPVAGLLQFAPLGSYGHRVHVHGVVTHSRPGEFLWIRDQQRGLRVQTRQTDALQAGDQVNVLGFPNRGGYTAVLEDAVFQKAGSGAIPAPVPLTDRSMALEHDADLVELRALLSERRASQDGWAYELDWNGTPLKALLSLPKGESPPGHWRLGSRIRAVGIWTVITDESGPESGIFEPQSFQLQLRSTADLSVLQPPPWWTRERIIWMLGGVAVASLAAVGAVMLLARKRLREQARRRAMAEAEFAAMLGERNRIAREIHDTLAQGLGAISMHLELVKDRLPAAAGEAGERLEVAHRLVRSSLTDARNSIWNMRSQVLENGDLATALEGVLRQLADGTGVETKMKVIGQSRRLPPVTENNLLRIGQEAITNATRHAHAKQIGVTLEFDEKQVRLSVSDNGQGFNTAQPPPGDGRFGLVGMQERAGQLRSQLSVHSAPGQGTRISLSVAA
jgi:signal transduction histidine kinase